MSLLSLHGGLPQRCCFIHTHSLQSHVRSVSGCTSTQQRYTVRTSAATTITAPKSSPKAPKDALFEAACPICQQTSFGLRPGADRAPQRLHCEQCSRTFISDEPYVDLTTTSGLKNMQSYQQSFWGGTEIFRSPLVSAVYERGWRQGFVWAGFPGADKELQMALEYLRPAWGQVLLDMSCGSGLFSRRFVQSRRFQGVIAADFSDNMLRQAAQFFSEDRSLSPQEYVLMRADVGRLPFATGSLAAVHAGAAIHCWPDPSQAVAEISRVLKPGGIFVASTFLNFASPLGQLIGDDNVRPLNKLENQVGTRTYKWWEELELQELCTAMGLTNFQRHRSRRFILFSVRKPGTLETST